MVFVGILNGGLMIRGAGLIRLGLALFFRWSLRRFCLFIRCF